MCERVFMLLVHNQPQSSAAAPHPPSLRAIHFARNDCTAHPVAFEKILTVRNHDFGDGKTREHFEARHRISPATTRHPNLKTRQTLHAPARAPAFRAPPASATMLKSQQTYAIAKFRFESAQHSHPLKHHRQRLLRTSPWTSALLTASPTSCARFHVGITTLSSGFFTLRKEPGGCRRSRQQRPHPWTNHGGSQLSENDLLDHRHAPTPSAVRLLINAGVEYVAEKPIRASGDAIRVRRVQHQWMMQTHLTGLHHDVVRRVYRTCAVAPCVVKLSRLGKSTCGTRPRSAIAARRANNRSRLLPALVQARSQARTRLSPVR